MVARLKNSVLEADCGAGNATDVRAADTQVVEFAVRHAAELADGFAVFAPAGEGACNVHDLVLFVPVGSLSGRLNLMPRVYAALRKGKVLKLRVTYALDAFQSINEVITNALFLSSRPFADSVGRDTGER